MIAAWSMLLEDGNLSALASADGNEEALSMGVKSTKQAPSS